MTESRSSRQSLKSRIDEAVGNLVYSSESDRPFEWFFLENGASGWPYDVKEFAARVGVDIDGPLEERTLDAFFKRHIEATDPYDSETQRIRPRYEDLKKTVSKSLRNVRVFRTGRIEVGCFVVGDDGAGNLAGIRTVAVET